MIILNKRYILTKIAIIDMTDVSDDIIKIKTLSDIPFKIKKIELFNYDNYDVETINYFGGVKNEKI